MEQGETTFLYLPRKVTVEDTRFQYKIAGMNGCGGSSSYQCDLPVSQSYRTFVLRTVLTGYRRLSRFRASMQVAPDLGLHGLVLRRKWLPNLNCMCCRFSTGRGSEKKFGEGNG